MKTLPLTETQRELINRCKADMLPHQSAINAVMTLVVMEAKEDLALPWKLSPDGAALLGPDVPAEG